MRGAGDLQQGAVGASRTGAAHADARVILHLTGDKDAGPVGQGGKLCAPSVVFRQARAAQGGQQRLCPADLVGGERLGDERLQPRRTGGIIVDAQIIAHQRQGRHQFRAQPARAQEAVLHPQEGGRGEMLGRLLARPDHQRTVGRMGVAGGGGAFLEPQCAVLAVELAQGAAFP